MSEHANIYSHPIEEYSFSIKNLPETPDSLIFNFDKFNIRVFADEEDHGYVFFTVSFPSKKDDQGYVLEEELTSSIEDTSQTNSISEDLVDYKTLKNKFNIFVKLESHDRYVTLNVSIKDEAFSSYTIIDPDCYQLKNTEH